MKLGLLTACLPDADLPAIAAWAAGVGYQALEVAAWPAGTGYSPTHVDAAALDEAEAARVRDLLGGHGLELSALAYYENNLHADPAERARVHDHLRACIDAAALLGCGLVGTFVGRDLTRDVADNLRLAEDVFPPLVEHAHERGVRLVVENCPMEGWHPDGYPANLAYSPELWEWMAGLGLHLNLDPSHLLWMGIDPVRALRDHAEQVLHVQAKDVQVDAHARHRYGVYGRVVHRTPWDTGWWRYRVPGLGDVDWSAFVDALHECGFDGVVSVEHEDPVWSGDQQRVERGLVLAHRALAPLVIV
jgi:sugar phosphate isomerase/epimerase